MVISNTFLPFKEQAIHISYIIVYAGGKLGLVALLAYFNATNKLIKSF